MATVLEPRRAKTADSLPMLRSGDHLDQRTFHERYLAMPREFRAELIGGVVFVPSPSTSWHGNYHSYTIHWLSHYRIHTPGTMVLDNGTVILDEDNEPQPDGVLRIDEAHGGQSRINKKGYVEGPPELSAEVAYSSEAIDLYEKHDEYAAAGVQEYVVVLVREQTVRFFRLENGKYLETSPDADGIWRSQKFPGLWLNVGALIHQNGVALIGALQEGLNTPENAAFVDRLQRAASANDTPHSG